MNLTKEDCKQIESYSGKLKQSPSDINSCRGLATVLSRATGKHIDVKISSNTDESSTYIMCVYPDDSTTTRILNAVTQNKSDDAIAAAWDGCSNWTVEIDRSILTNMKLNFTERELTALILHEVQHMLYATSVRKRMCDAIKVALINQNLVMRNTFKDNFFSKLINPLWYDLCKLSIPKQSAELKKELNADKYATKLGYGSDLLSAIQKILAISKSNNSSVFSNSEQQANAVLTYSAETINDLKKRETALARKNYAKLNSNIDKVQESIDYNLERIFVDPVTNRTTDCRKFYDMVYSILEKVETETYNSEFFFEAFGTKKLKKIDQYDLGYIDLQIDAARTNEDRILVLSYIHSKLDLVEYYIALLEKNDRRYIIPHTKEQLYRMRDRLHDSEKRLIQKNTNLNPINAVIINYPNGYEG